jgi:glyoxylase-like metal-dependent hydrolase (beta-lactamase superfamily II)
VKYYILKVLLIKRKINNYKYFYFEQFQHSIIYNKPSNMADLDISHIVTGPLDVNCYIIGDPKSKKALVIDPGGSPDEILSICKEKGFELESIYLTHAHFDHVLGIRGLRAKTQAKIYLHKADMEIYKILPLQVKFFGFSSRISTKDCEIPDPDVFIKEGENVMINGEPVAKIYHTPGHSPGSVCFLFEKLNKIFTGDTLFRTSVGRTDLWEGSYEQIRNSVRGKLFKMDDNIEVLPGHGPSSSIGYEKTHNYSV